MLEKHFKESWPFKVIVSKCFRRIDFISIATLFSSGQKAVAL